jgi:hypothetical protein
VVIYHRFAKLIKPSNRTRHGMASDAVRICGQAAGKPRFLRAIDDQGKALKN